jgi:hypothetical protein
MLRTYAFSGRKKAVLALLSIAFFGLVGVILWVISRELSRLSRSHCSPSCIPDSWNRGFAVSDLPAADDILVTVIQGVDAVYVPIGYHM